MNILVTGANGQLGNEMRIVAKDSKDKYVFTDVVEIDGQETVILDITDLDAVRSIVKKNDVRVIVNCAAWTNVDGAEDPDKYDLVELLNAKAPENLAIAMKEANGLLVHISTDYVFGGDLYNTPCKEEQKGTPTGVYGMTKLHGEENIQKSGVNYIILRTAWLYSEFGKNFVKTMLNLTSTRPQLKVVFDQVGTPTYAYDLAMAIKTVIEDYSEHESYKSSEYSSNSSNSCSKVKYDKTGIYHFSNEGVCSWYDFTKMIQQIALELGYYESLPKQGDLEGLCDIQPCHSDEFPSPVKRPSYSVLDKTKVKQTFGLTIPYWTDSLRKCITNLLNQ